MIYDEILTAAIADFERFGFDSQERLEKWQMLLEQAAYAKSLQSGISAEELKRKLNGIYTAQVGTGAIFKHHGISKFTIAKVKPKLHLELQRRIMASANLIKLNRTEMIASTIRRFAGWASSIPAGGTGAIDKRETKQDIRKVLKSLPFTERRVMIDQGAKFTASLNSIIANENGAIAARWHSRWRAAGYENYRREHRKRDKEIFIIRGNWAIEQGLIKLNGHQYTDEITMPGEEIYCSCTYEYLYNLRDVPELLTEKGKQYVNQ